MATTFRSPSRSCLSCYAIQNEFRPHEDFARRAARNTWRIASVRVSSWKLYLVTLTIMYNRSIVRIMLMVAYGMDIKKDAKEVGFTMRYEKRGPSHSILVARKAHHLEQRDTSNDDSREIFG